MHTDTQQASWHRFFWFLRWRSWSIRTRLMVIAVFPVFYLFFSLLSYSYFARLREVEDELNARAKTITTALADGVEYNLIAGNVQGIKQMIYGVIQSDQNVYRIDIVDANKVEMSHVENAGRAKPEVKFVELPVKRHMVWVNLHTENHERYELAQSKEKAQTILGYVRVTMTRTYLLDKQRYRFSIELLMSLLALAASGCLAWYLSKGLTSPLHAAIEALKDISAGRTNTQIPLTHGGEVGELQRSLNEMARSLHQSQTLLEDTVVERTKELTESRNQALKADAEKRRLIHKVNAIVENERQSIAVEIHDELNASLIAVRLEAERIAKMASRVEVNGDHAPIFLEIQERAKSVVKLALDLYANGRNLVRRLRPEVLDMLGLEGAIEEMLRLYNAGHEACHFEFTTEGELTQLDADLAISVYRIVQEACSNILKHAEATQVSIKLTRCFEPTQLCIEIKDNGVGFDPEQAVAGIGISGMRERVLAWGGEFQLRSEVGQGTEIRISLPAT
ncbi:sensor histidine kinase [Undibacterium fentianense]|uniref:Oxygen sensor histidine kinase NreB n=1 Tax=Undibacterium fentianense TaxID=2828728 RepID=A0A941E2X0_9BURK|nr:ATP-binding protein [Undibacterium fentianense]MBR7801370.1 HAMP domain-containing protein [Undibacterium fentianense]